MIMDDYILRRKDVLYYIIGPVTLGVQKQHQR
jgi:hypothetical protein